ncbi:P-loop containing nucleoside triphosphate hydrolase protein [Staphylotrichum tortipilum]|uniref:P-loop containing nucleoside triphosphate hydrolase protein n=1 Tax=Staphylotrichum tortipilum TaxID=2831512 RepID=A0AAN6MIV6_9PEZI|nr:P-loop containing nucleoside triphosphate hydrolase protein [Staphylotrichum longicolle]
MSATEDPITQPGPETEEQERDHGGLWGLRQLKKVVAAAKGKATYQVVEFIKHHLEGTKLIFVFGRTGTGKTTLLKELTGMDLKVGEKLGSGTHHYEICPAIIAGDKYIFVDTPGFGAADKDNFETMKDIMSCLLALGPFVIITGALFVYDSAQDRLSQDEAITIRWLQCFCGPDFYEKITVVSNKWDQLVAKERLKKKALFEDLQVRSDLAQVLNPPGRYRSGHVYHHGIRTDTMGNWCEALDHEESIPERKAQAQEMIQKWYANPATVKLQIRKELDRGTKLAETSAAKALAAHVVATKVRVKHGEAIILGTEEPDPVAEPPVVQPTPPSIPWVENPESNTFKFWEWLEIAKQAALFFWQGHRSAMEQTAQNSRGIFGWLKVCSDKINNWWSGPPPNP